MYTLLRIMLVMLISCAQRNELENPEIVAESYIKSSLNFDIKKMTYFETGIPDAFEKKYGIFASEVLRETRNRRRMSSPEYVRWEVRRKIYKESKIAFFVKFTYPDFAQLGEITREYLGYFREGPKIIKKKPFESNISYEEALKLAHKDKRLHFEEKIIELNLKRINANWVISENNKQFSCSMFPKDGCE